MSSSNPNEQQQSNEGANHWHYDVGVPTIPGRFKQKKPSLEDWREYQWDPPSDSKHKTWVDQGKYSGGVMILCGRALHRKDKENLYLVGIDIDRQKGIDAFLTRGGKTSSLHADLAKTTIVEQHEDSPDRVHIFFYSPFKFPKKGPDDEVGIEIKSSWDHGLMRVSPSVTENGYPLKILGTTEPKTLNEAGATELLQHLDRICTENGVKYLEEDDGSRGYLTPELKQVIKSLNVSFDKKAKVKIQSGRRNVTLISVANSILSIHLRKDKSNEEELKEFFFAINYFLCDGPLPNSEVESIWASAFKWMYPRILDGSYCRRQTEQEKEQQKKTESLFTKLNCKYYFKTLKDTEEIWYYDEDKGVFVSNGEVLIKGRLQKEFGSRLTNQDVSEFLGRVQRDTYFDRSGFNPDIQWLGCADRMLNLRTGQTAPFSPDFLNTTCIPVKYSEVYATGSAADFFRLVERDAGIYDNCQCPKIMRFLYDIVAPEDVELLLDYIAYSLWRSYKFANWFLLVGAGQNGKSIFLNLVERFLGKDNTSSESLERILNERFAPALLYQKLANFDADVSGDILIKNTGKIKKLTGNDEYPGEFKYKTPFKFRNFSKLYFSCNEIPETDDKTDAFFRRLIIVNFTRQFLGELDDPHILEKIGTEEEFSGLLHEILGRLPRIIQQGIRPTTNEAMQETYEKYIRSSDPVQYFVEKALTAKDDAKAFNNLISKKEMYDSYCLFCRAHRLAPESEQAFSRDLSGKGYSYRRTSRNRIKGYYWEHVKLKDWKVVEDSAQEILDSENEAEGKAESG